MNSFATLGLIYALFTVVSSSILYGSFRKKMDASAIYFLISEICMTSTCAAIFLINMKIIYPNVIWTVIPNFSALCAEVAILFSVLSLTKKIHRKWFLLALILTGSLAIFLELIRSEASLQTVVWIFTGSLMCLFSANYFVCKFKLPAALSKNEFMRLFTWLQLAIVIYGFIRLVANLLPSPIVPRDTPSDLAVVVFSIYVVAGAFRYIAYIGLRITWIDPLNPSQNRLNKPLAQAIEEKDQLLRGLIASNRVIGISALASSLAHQLSQPLTTIALRADTTRRSLVQTGQDPQTIASLDEISSQSTKLAELVKNLRQLFGSRGYEFAPINLQKITDEIIEIVEPSLEAKKIVLLKNYESNPVVYGDSIQIQQVLINVFNNAIDVLAQVKTGQKEILIGITSNKAFATLTIKDSGDGIDPKLLPDIFELYKTTKKGGLGVGLWLSKTIIEHHHGHITAFNDANGGAIFKIQIPLHRTLGE